MSLTDVEDTVLRFRFATTEARPEVAASQEQGIPIPREVLNTVYAIQSRLRRAQERELEPQSPSQGVDH